MDSFEVVDTVDQEITSRADDASQQQPEVHHPLLEQQPLLEQEHPLQHLEDKQQQPPVAKVERKIEYKTCVLKKNKTSQTEEDKDDIIKKLKDELEYTRWRLKICDNANTYLKTDVVNKETIIEQLQLAGLRTTQEIEECKQKMSYAEKVYESAARQLGHEWREKFETVNYAPVLKSDLQGLLMGVTSLREELYRITKQQRKSRLHKCLHNNKLVKLLLKPFMKEKKNDSLDEDQPRNIFEKVWGRTPLPAMVTDRPDKYW